MLPWPFVTAFAAGAIMAALGVALIVRPERGAVAAMGWFLLARGVFNVFVSPYVGGLPIESPVLKHITGYWSVLGMLIPLLTIWFVSIYPRRRWWTGRPKVMPVVLVLMFVLLVVLRYTWPAHFDYHPNPDDQTIPRHHGPLFVLYAALLPLYGWASVAFAVDHAKQRPGPVRTSLLLLGVGFALDAVYVGTRMVTDLWLDVFPVSLQSPQQYTWAMALVPAATAAGIWLHSARRAASSEARGIRLAAASLLLPLAAGVLGPISKAQRWAAVTPWSGHFEAIFVLTFPAILAYGVLRHRVFDIDVRLQRGAGYGLLMAATFAIAFAAAAGVQPVIGDETLSVVAVALLTGALAVPPLRWLGTRVGAAVPIGIAATPEYLDGRRLAVYRAALELDALDPRSPASLRRLRTRLGISDRDHQLLSMGMQSAVPAANQRAAATRFVNERPLGAGGQGTTTRAIDAATGDEVVIKRLHGPRATDLLREAEALLALDHPNVVPLLDARIDDGRLCLVSPYAGRDLRRILTKGPLDLPDLDALARDLLSGLQHIHDAGIVHRDIKPANILFADRYRIADFGIAAGGNDADDDITAATADPGALGVPGTLVYMSPEQARDGDVDALSDLYQAAATLYEAWTCTPYEAPRPGETGFAFRTRVSTLRTYHGDATKPWATWFRQALDSDPGERFPSAADALAAWPTGISRVPHSA